MDSLEPSPPTREGAETLPAAWDNRLAGLLIDAVDEYAIFALEPTGRVCTWNKGARRIKGYDAGEIIGRHFSVFYPPEDVRAGKPERELLHAVKHGQTNDEGWRVRKDGSQFWANVTITAIFHKSGVLEGFAKITRDDSDRKRLEEQIRQIELFTDRERIAQAMHGTIVHRIFEASLAMEGALKLIHHPVAVEGIDTAIAALDQTLRELRTVILDLDHAEQLPPKP